MPAITDTHKNKKKQKPKTKTQNPKAKNQAKPNIQKITPKKP